MSNHSKKSDNGVPTMRPETRDFFVWRFMTGGKLDAAKAANYFGVAERTVYNWWRHGCPAWVDNYVVLAQRAIPNTKEWDGFRFGGDDRLYTPYKKHSSSADDILWVFYERQFANISERNNRQMDKQLDALRDDFEANAIREQLDEITKTLQGLKTSPILAPKGQYSKRVSKAEIVSMHGLPRQNPLIRKVK